MTDNAKLEHVLDIPSIQQIVSRIATYTDQKRWSDHRWLFADEVTVDFGGVKLSQTIQADQLVA